MFEDRSSARKRFLSAPPSIPAAVAAIMEPALASMVLIACHRQADLPLDSPVRALIVLLLVLMFPGVNRFGKVGSIGLLIDIALSWATVVAVLLLLGYATGSLGAFDHDVLLNWALITPVVQWLAVQFGSWVIRSHASRPEARRSAVVIGAGHIGQRVASALRRRRDYGHDLAGLFDDR